MQTYVAENTNRDLRLFRVDPMIPYYDNKAGTKIAHTSIQHDRMEHIEIDRHFLLREIQ